jgi:hypothetical protein
LLLLIISAACRDWNFSRRSEIEFDFQDAIVLQSFWMRSRGQIHAFLRQNFYLNALFLLRELPRERICIPFFRNEATKVRLAQPIFSRRQLDAIAPPNHKMIAPFLKVSHALVYWAKINFHSPGDGQDFSDAGRPSLISPRAGATSPMAAQQLLAQGSPSFHSGSEVRVWKPSMSGDIDPQRGEGTHVATHSRFRWTARHCIVSPPFRQQPFRRLLLTGFSAASRHSLDNLPGFANSQK